MRCVVHGFFAVVFLGGLVSAQVQPVGLPRVTARTMETGALSRLWEYSANLKSTPTYSSLSRDEGTRSGTVQASNEGEARKMAEAEIREGWGKDHPFGGYFLTITMADGYPRPVESPRPPATEHRTIKKPIKPLSEPPVCVTLKKSGDSYNVHRVIGSDHSCLIATLPRPSTITEVRVQAHDNLDKTHEAALWVYVDGAPVGKVEPQRAVAKGSLITWKFPRAVEGSVISIVARHQNWNTDGSVKGTETAYIEWIAADFKPSQAATSSSVLADGTPNIIIPSGDIKTYTFVCDLKNAKRILVFADDNISKTHRAHLEVMAGAEKLGKRQPVYAAGGWLVYNLEKGMTGDLVFKAYHEDGKENGDDVRLHYVAVLK